MNIELLPSSQNGSGQNIYIYMFMLKRPVQCLPWCVVLYNSMVVNKSTTSCVSIPTRIHVVYKLHCIVC